jgi:hypothetical protein
MGNGGAAMRGTANRSGTTNSVKAHLQTPLGEDFQPCAPTTHLPTPLFRN